MIIRLVGGGGGGGVDNRGVQEFGVKGHLGVILGNSNMLALLHSCPAICFVMLLGIKLKVGMG